MKYISPFVAFSILLLTISSCEKEENKIYYEEGTPPVLTSSATDITLEPGLESNTAVALSWTNPNYIFTTGVSSHDVTYALEIDTLGANFGSSKKYTSVISKEMSKSFTVAEFNDILGNDMLLQLNPRRDYTLELRIVSSIGSSVKLNSNVVTVTTKPFAPPPKVVPPDAGTLWIIGDAVASGWDINMPPPYDVTQKFTKVTNTLYELIVPMPGGGFYKFVQEKAWGSQYRPLTGATWEGGSFEKRDADPGFSGPPGSGTYKITVDFQTGKFSVVKQ
jgi:hypothetical protein